MRHQQLTGMTFLTASAIACGLSATLQASLLGPAWPAPGGNSYSQAGQEGDYGGKTYTYTGFDPAQYLDLYWGPWEGAVLGLSMDGEMESREHLVFQPGLSDFANGKAVWARTVHWAFRRWSSTTAQSYCRYTFAFYSRPALGGVILGASLYDGRAWPPCCDFVGS